MYSKNMYGTFSYASETLNNPSVNIEASEPINLMEHLPNFYHDSKFVKAFMDSCSILRKSLVHFFAEFISC